MHHGETQQEAWPLRPCQGGIGSSKQTFAQVARDLSAMILWDAQVGSIIVNGFHSSVGLREALAKCLAIPLLTKGRPHGLDDSRKTCATRSHH